jgi:hypothetical protein
MRRTIRLVMRRTIRLVMHRTIRLVMRRTIRLVMHGTLNVKPVYLTAPNVLSPVAVVIMHVHKYEIKIT